MAELLGFEHDRMEPMTQTAVQRWLREEHSLICSPFEVATMALHTGVGFYAYVGKVDKIAMEIVCLFSSNQFYTTYEAAMEISLTEALKHLYIKKQ